MPPAPRTVNMMPFLLSILFSFLPPLLATIPSRHTYLADLALRLNTEFFREVNHANPHCFSLPSTTDPEKFRRGETGLEYQTAALAGHVRPGRDTTALRLDFDVAHLYIAWSGSERSFHECSENSERKFRPGHAIKQYTEGFVRAATRVLKRDALSCFGGGGCGEVSSWVFVKSFSLLAPKRMSDGHTAFHFHADSVLTQHWVLEQREGRGGATIYLSKHACNKCSDFAREAGSSGLEVEFVVSPRAPVRRWKRDREDGVTRAVGITTVTDAEFCVADEIEEVARRALFREESPRSEPRVHLSQQSSSSPSEVALSKRFAPLTSSEPDDEDPAEEPNNARPFEELIVRRRAPQYTTSPDSDQASHEPTDEELLEKAKTDNVLATVRIVTKALVAAARDFSNAVRLLSAHIDVEHRSPSVLSSEDQLGSAQAREYLREIFEFVLTQIAATEERLQREMTAAEEDTEIRQLLDSVCEPMKDAFRNEGLAFYMQAQTRQGCGHKKREKVNTSMEFTMSFGLEQAEQLRAVAYGVFARFRQSQKVLQAVEIVEESLAAQLEVVGREKSKKANFSESLFSDAVDHAGQARGCLTLANKLHQAFLGILSEENAKGDGGSYGRLTYKIEIVEELFRRSSSEETVVVAKARATAMAAVWEKQVTKTEQEGLFSFDEERKVSSAFTKYVATLPSTRGDPRRTLVGLGVDGWALLSATLSAVDEAERSFLDERKGIFKLVAALAWRRELFGGQSSMEGISEGLQTYYGTHGVGKSWLGLSGVVGDLVELLEGAEDEQRVAGERGRILESLRFVK